MLDNMDGGVGGVLWQFDYIRVSEGVAGVGLKCCCVVYALRSWCWNILPLCRGLVYALRPWCWSIVEYFAFMSWSGLRLEAVVLEYCGVFCLYVVEWFTP